MPWGDRTGPRGLGPRTGRGLGYCSGYTTPGYMKGPGMGRGWGGGRGRGWGGGRGRGWGGPWGEYPEDVPLIAPPYPPVSYQPSPTDETKYLEQVLDNFRKEMEMIEKRLAELAKEK